MALFGLGTVLYVSLLMINAIAILNEDRFLAKIGWLTPSRQGQMRDVNTGFQQPYDPTVYGGAAPPPGDIGVKARLVDLISAVRTLMRIPLIVINTLVILYELVWG
ncbi:Yos1-like protein [Pholiota conissans]|uniref:Yos1-like protein n=1 Tax=Pholiota conissans TaxID=109636 RepID=A0A9P5ZC64_9AGAR|nr:Yos1-like protein [Pholiota conissans]